LLGPFADPADDWAGWHRPDRLHGTDPYGLGAVSGPAAWSPALAAAGGDDRRGGTRAGAPGHLDAALPASRTAGRLSRSDADGSW